MQDSVADADYTSPLQPSIRVDDPLIVEAIRPLSGPRDEWNLEDVWRSVPALRRRVGFIAGGCSAPTSVAWQVCVMCDALGQVGHW